MTDNIEISAEVLKILSNYEMVLSLYSLFWVYIFNKFKARWRDLL